MFDSIVNDEVRYPRFLSLEAIAIMRRVSQLDNFLSQILSIMFNPEIVLMNATSVFSCFGRTQSGDLAPANATPRMSKSKLSSG